MHTAGGTKRPLALLALSAGAGLLAVACARPPELGPGQAPLLDPPSQLQVLVESRLIELPPALDGNRFVAGWRSAGGAAKRSVVADAPVSRLEAVNLSNDERTLVLAFDAPPSGTVRARIAGGPWRTVRAAERTEVPLPAPLPIGRVPIELALPPNAPPLQAASSPARPAGEVRVGARAIVQGGASLVEIVRPLRGHAIVSGELEPPSQPRDGQVIELRQRCDGKDQLLWRWQPRWWDSLRRPAFRVEAGCSSGWLHLRLLAPLPGPAATWRRLSLHQPAPAARGDGAPTPTSPASPAPASRPPRLLLVYVFDALRSDAAGKRRQERSVTPVLDGLAANGVSFEQHLAPAPSTLPSTKALFTGHTWRRRGGVRLGPDLPTLAEAFRSAGYRTGLFSGNVYVSPAFGMHRGFEVAPQDTLADEEKLGTANDNAARVNAAALGWLSTLPPDAKAFLYLHVIHPHNPYQPPDQFASDAKVAGSDIDGSTRTLLDIVHRRRRVTAADQARIAALYQANLAYADSQFGELLSALRERFRPDESLVVATADHGEELFDHGGLLHGYTLYDEQIRIPLILNWPGTIAPQRFRQPTSTLHLHNALLEIARERPAPLAALLAPRPFEDDVHFAAAANVRGGIFTARSPRWKVIWAPRTGQGWGMGAGLGRGHDAELVFDLSTDPQERHNLAGTVDDPEVLWLRAKLQSWAAQPDGDADAQDSNDPETRARLRALGYVQ